MAHSANGRRVALVLLGTIALAGCTSTQHEAQRVRLDSARQRAALESTRVTEANTLVTATAISEVRAGRRTAFVVTVHNAGSNPVTDLPISIGYTVAGASVYLNSAANLNYFEAHLPAIEAGHALTWVYTANRVLPPGARVFARVGRRRSAPALLTETNVRIKLEYRYTASTRSVTVRLDNPTSVPQYELQLYAYAKRGAHYVGAASRTIMTLGAGSEHTVRLGLVGESSGELHVQAVPTILQ